MFNIEDHRRYVAIPKRKKAKERKTETKVVLPNQRKVSTPNYKETSQIDCAMLYGKPCKCRRMIGLCIQCRREFAVTLGERADVQYAHEKGRILNYKCNVCKVQR